MRSRKLYSTDVAVYAEKYGVLDEQHRARDIIGDTQVAHLGWSILLYTSLRSAGPMILAYKPNVVPLLGLSLMSLPKIMAWEVVIDLFFCPSPVIV